MEFEPMGGYPPIVPVTDDEISEKTLESRGFATTKIASISDIMDSKKKEDLFVAFGSDSEDTESMLMQARLEGDRPAEYNGISYKAVPKLNLK